MEPYTQEQRAEIAKLMSEGCSYFEAVMKMSGITGVEVCINGESVPLDSIGFHTGQLILDKSDVFQDLLKSCRKIGNLCVTLAIKMLPHRIKIKRPPQPNRRKKKKARNKK